MAEILGVYLYGSTVAGGLRPDSDLDVFVVTRRRLTSSEKSCVFDRLMPISGRDTRPRAWRPLEVTVVAQGDVRPWRYPPRMDLQYGEWLRKQFLADGVVPEASVSPDLAILVFMVRESSRVLAGLPPRDLLDAVPLRDLHRAMTDELATLLDELEDDTRNVLLTLVRIWATLMTGQILSKADAAAWAMERLAPEERATIARARDLYLQGGFGPWNDPHVVRATAASIEREIRLTR